ncbi:hypothetical protein ACFQY5_34430 [Paeniroseomonas aquatica]|uniref:Uncharacterized protein n=1 Tax=Paeniroseomonas aquatica TaxID=373043 RepID=A0ABT8A0E2_9PROT|nr:hypothetical protein [Paeniroseomonas aquatica]MDN3563009.1 hypothetical protein [Paeniroseomonas aquatica]
MEEAMGRLALEGEAGQASAEFVYRNIAAGTRVHVVVEAVEGSDALPMAAITQAGGAFDWLADEPDLYADADLADSAPSPSQAG